MTSAFHNWSITLRFTYTNINNQGLWILIWRIPFLSSKEMQSYDPQNFMIASIKKCIKFSLNQENICQISCRLKSGMLYRFQVRWGLRKVQTLILTWWRITKCNLTNLFILQHTNILYKLQTIKMFNPGSFILPSLVCTKHLMVPDLDTRKLNVKAINLINGMGSKHQLLLQETATK